MTLWIKICGMTTPQGVAAALDAKVDAIGFVFASSVRKVTAEKASALALPARGRVACAAVTRHPSQAAVDDILENFKPDVLQTDAADLATLRLPQQLSILPVYREWDDAMQLPSRLLFEGQTSGSGVTCDWAAAARIANRSEVILAGGLNAANVASAIAEVRPFGVDVSSGVEECPGIKSPAEIERFVTAARSASSRS